MNFLALIYNAPNQHRNGHVNNATASYLCEAFVNLHTVRESEFDIHQILENSQMVAVSEAMLQGLND
jgi:hypothetical protein